MADTEAALKLIAHKPEPSEDGDRSAAAGLFAIAGVIEELTGAIQEIAVTMTSKEMRKALVGRASLGQLRYLMARSERVDLIPASVSGTPSRGGRGGPFLWLQGCERWLNQNQNGVAA